MRRRPLEWECADLADFVQLPTNTCDQVVLLPTGAYDEEYTDGTLRRVRGHLEIYPVAQPPVPATTVVAYSQGAAGIIELSGQPSEDPLTLVACPLEDCEQDWLWHTFWSVHERTGQPGAAGTPVDRFVVPFIIDIDSRAQRRIESGASSLWFGIENDVTSLAVDYWFGVRMLLAEK